MITLKLPKHQGWCQLLIYRSVTPLFCLHRQAPPLRLHLSRCLVSLFRFQPQKLNLSACHNVHSRLSARKNLLSSHGFPCFPCCQRWQKVFTFCCEYFSQQKSTNSLVKVKEPIQHLYPSRSKRSET